MILQGQEVKAIEEAFLLLPEEDRHHADRVSAYTEAAFRKVTGMDLYVSDPRSRTELDLENLRGIRLGALYHDIGKLLPDETAPAEGREIAREHCLNGAELAQALPPESGRFQPTERRLYLSCIREHHEMPCGGGFPIGKPMKELAFGGRLVAIADRLDHLAMEIKSEDPIGDALNFLKKDARAARLDPEFYRAFSAVRPRLRKIFNEYRGEARAVPENDPWIRRRSSRPLELRYYKATLQDVSPRETETAGEGLAEPAASAAAAGLPSAVWIAVMCFRNISDNSCSFEDVRALINGARLAPDLGRYFLYELMDTVRRFDTVGAALPAYALELPAGWFAQKELAELLRRALEDEEVKPERLLLLTPPELSKAQSAALEKQIPAVKALGITILPRAVFTAAYACGEAFREGPDVSGSLLREDDIVDEALKREA